ncbi:MAG: efflux RND transporter permease subunit [Halioglobus sp.]
MKFFIERPNLAIVISVLITLAGLISVSALPVGRYPNVAPPTVEVLAFMQGANAEIVSKVIAPEIEKQVNGVEGMDYMKSTSASDGSYTLEIVFGLDVDVDKAVTLVQNRVNKSVPELPEAVRVQGITVEKVSSGMVLGLSVFDQNDKHSDIDISGFSGGPLKEALQRVPGVSKVDIMGEKRYSMRIWVDPKKMARYKVNITDIEQAVREQNQILPAGRVIGDDLEFTLTVKPGLETTKDFEEILIRAEPQTRPVQLKDVGRVELGAETYIANAYTDNKDGTIIFIYRAPDANAMEVGAGVKQVLDQIDTPDGMEISLVYDTTSFISAALANVIETLILAVLIVSLVTLLFMQSWRTTLITICTIPVSLIGTFALFLALDISINIISMFGLVLAIGIVVDAAIIVVENVERVLHEHPDKPIKDAVETASGQVVGPIIASAVVLLAVFAPTIFMGGLTGVIYSEFGIVLSGAVLVSTAVALSLTPAMAVMLMRREKKGPLGRMLEGGIAGGIRGFAGIAHCLVKVPVSGVIVLAVVCYGIYHFGNRIPSGLIPNEDTSAAFVAANFEPGTSLAVTDRVTREIVEELKQIEGVNSVVSAAGVNLITNASEMSANMMLLSLTPMEEREITDDSVIRIANEVLGRHDELEGFAFKPPPIPELGLVDGIDLVLKDLNGVTPIELHEVASAFIDDANASEAIALASTQYAVNKPAIFLDLDRLKSKQYGVDIDTAVNALQSYAGGSFINNFNLGGRNYRVMIQNERSLTKKLEDIANIELSYQTGVSFRFGDLFKAERTLAPSFITRYNAQQAVSLNVFPNVSSGDAIAALNAIKLPKGFAIEYSGMTRQEVAAGNAAAIAFGMALLITFLVLVGQYESWSIPTVIMLTVPTAIIGIVWGVMALGGTINIMTQIAAILLVGMCVRNAILIVEFAKDLRENKKMSITDAAVEAVRLRARAVAMTALSFALGVLPLMLANGTGMGGQLAIGYASFGGILTATIIGCLLAPVLYVIIQGVREKLARKPSSQ